MDVAVRAGEASAADRATDPHRIVIVGGGAGGLELATRLGDRLGRRSKADITLIEKARAHFWKPLCTRSRPAAWILATMSSTTSRRPTGTISAIARRDDRARPRAARGARRRPSSRRTAPRSRRRAASATIRS